jgi:hypothetical protein
VCACLCVVVCVCVCVCVCLFACVYETLGNYIDPAGATAISNALKLNNSVEILNLSCEWHGRAESRVW